MIHVDESDRVEFTDFLVRDDPYCQQTYNRSNSRPVVFKNEDIVLLHSGRAGSTFAIRWYLDQNDLTSEHGWTHDHRVKEIYPSSWHVERCEAVASGVPFKMARFCRNPYSRAVSSYLHSLLHEWIHRRIVEWVGRDSGYSFLEFLNFIADAGVQCVDSHFATQVAHLEFMYRLDAFHRIEDGIDGLHAFEAELGVSPTSLDRYRWMVRSGHHLPYDVADDAAADRVFAIGPRAPIYPSPDAFYDERTVELVKRLYAADFESYGYSTDLPDLKPKVTNGRDRWVPS